MEVQVLLYSIFLLSVRFTDIASSRYTGMFRHAFALETRGWYCRTSRHSSIPMLLIYALTRFAVCSLPTHSAFSLRSIWKLKHWIFYLLDQPSLRNVHNNSRGLRRTSKRWRTTLYFKRESDTLQRTMRLLKSSIGNILVIRGRRFNWTKCRNSREQL